MARHRNIDWSVPEGRPSPRGNVHDWEAIYVSLLMDIRETLQEIKTSLVRVRSVLECGNTTDIPRILRRIDENTKKRTRTKKPPSAK